MTLFEMVRQALNDASTEAELAEALAGAEILSRVVEEATWTDQQVQEALSYAPAPSRPSGASPRPSRPRGRGAAMAPQRDPGLPPRPRPPP